MHLDQILELRVLTGTHAGARALLPEVEQTIGRDSSCDLILSDEGLLARHARLEPQEDGSVVLHWLDSDLEPLVLRPGSGAQLGPVQIAVEPADAPWRDEASSEASAREQNEAGPETSDRIEPSLDLDGALPHEATTASWRSSLTAPLATRWSVLGVAAAGLLALGTLGWMLQHPATREVAPASHPAGGPPSGPPIDPVRQAVARLGLGKRVRVQVGPKETWVQASFLTDAESETLAATLSHLSPRPRLQLESEPDTLIAVTDAIQQLGGDVMPPLAARHLGAGRFRLEGRVADDKRRNEVVAAMQSQFPQAEGFESALVTDAEVAQAMVTLLQDQGLGDIVDDWSEGVLKLDVKLKSTDVRAWERALVAAASRYEIPFRATVQPALEASSADMTRLPFTVRSIVSGDLPYLMLGDGSRLMPGGSVKGWRLVEIKPQSILLEAANGQRMSMER